MVRVAVGGREGGRRCCGGRAAGEMEDGGGERRRMTEADGERGEGVAGTQEGSYRRVETATAVNCINHGRKTAPQLVVGMAHTFTDRVYLAKHFSVALTGVLWP
jgi:hypothetical protein